MEQVRKFWQSAPPIGANKPYLVLCNGEPFAGADSEPHAKEMVSMYGRQIKLKNKNELAYCSRQSWTFRKQ